MASVIPSSSALSVEAAGGGTYLYSFFNTVLLKYGFSLKCYRNKIRHYFSIHVLVYHGVNTLTNSIVKHLVSTGSLVIQRSSK